MFERWFRQQGFFRKAVDDETRDAILDAERARVTAWVERRKLSSNIEVDDGCVGPVPEGVTITIRIAGVDRAKLVPLLDDIDLDGSLRKLLVEKAWVRLFFVPLRSTDVYDIALRRVEELLSAPEPTPEPPERNGPYRPYRTTSFQGNGPDLGDSMSLSGPESDVTVDLGQSSVHGYGGEILFPGVVGLQTDAGGRKLTQVGTSRDDAFCYDPMAPRDGRLYIVGAPGGGTATSVCDPDLRGSNVLNTFVEVSQLVLDPGDGSDEVIVNGTTSRDLISVQAHAPLTEVAVHAEPDNGSTFRLPLEAVVASTESVVVAADNGSDSVDVTAYDSSAPLITVYGESPATMKDADSLVLRDGTGAAHLSDVTSHTKGSGTVLAEYTKGSGAVIRVNYIDVEFVDLIRDPKS